MNIISHGDNYEIYTNELETMGALPNATFKVNFNPMSGFSLVKTTDFENQEEKIYGTHLQKIDKLLRSYDAFSRSLGLILSGDKGMGKSLFVQLLSEAAIAKGLPVIIVNKAIPGVGEFIEKIDQEVLVVFDEFEKIFPIRSEGGAESQEDLLGLFDGTSQRKRLYAITVNKVFGLSDYMLNRTGRFHYHLRFDYPTAEETAVYLKDKVKPAYVDEIKQVVAFSRRVKLNYDTLRAVAFELNQGYPFTEAIDDLNIINTETQYYDVQVHFSDGESALVPRESMDLFESRCYCSGHRKDNEYFEIQFSTANIRPTEKGLIVDGADAKIVGSCGRDSDVKVVSMTLMTSKANRYSYSA